MLLVAIDLDQRAGEGLADPIGQQIDLEQIDDRSLILLGPSFRESHLLREVVEGVKDPAGDRLVCAQGNTDPAGVAVHEAAKLYCGMGVIASQCGMTAIFGKAASKASIACPPEQQCGGV